MVTRVKPVEVLVATTYNGLLNNYGEPQELRCCQLPMTPDNALNFADVTYSCDVCGARLRVEWPW